MASPNRGGFTIAKGVTSARSERLPAAWNAEGSKGNELVESHEGCARVRHFSITVMVRPYREVDLARSARAHRR